MIVSMVYLKIKEKTAYSFDFLTQVLSYPLRLLVLVFLWSVLLVDNKTLAGFSLSSVILYFTLQRIISDGLQMGTFAENFQDEILEGTLDIHLTRPVRVYSVKFAEVLTNLLLSLLSLIYFPVIYFFIGGIAVPLLNWGYFFLYLVFSIIIGFLISFIFGLIPLFLGRSTPLISTLFLVIGMISGSLFPVQMFPDYVISLIEKSPFYYLYTAPLTFILSPTSNVNIFIPLLWIMILGFISQIMWRKGIGRYSGQGG